MSRSLAAFPLMMQGYNLEDVTPGVDETLIRQPLGVVAAITPFNFPAMIPFWFLPYAIACGNTLVMKPSERVPLTMRRAMELIEKTGLAQRRRQPCQRRQGSSRCALRSSDDSRRQFCRLNARSETRLPAFGGQRQAHAVPGWREKSCHRAS